MEKNYQINSNFKNFENHKFAPFSETVLEIKFNAQNFGITRLFNDYIITCLNISKTLENVRNNKFALSSETVRDKAKRTKFGDHMTVQWSQHNIF